jgi:hypothetical protein
MNGKIPRGSLVICWGTHKNLGYSPRMGEKDMVPGKLIGYWIGETGLMFNSLYR